MKNVDLNAVTEMCPCLYDGVDEPEGLVLFAHGAGAGMESDFMEFFAVQLAEQLKKDKVGVLRFEFPYMAKTRRDGKKRPPDRMPKLLEAMGVLLSTLAPVPILLAGKSMGGRVSSMVANADSPEVNGGTHLPGRPDQVVGWMAFGYPFHPPGKLDRLRVSHLVGAHSAPGLVLQGTRDPFGSVQEQLERHLGNGQHISWLEDGNHDLVPRKSSGRSKTDNWSEAVRLAAEFARSRFDKEVILINS